MLYLPIKYFKKNIKTNNNFLILKNMSPILGTKMILYNCFIAVLYNCFNAEKIKTF